MFMASKSVNFVAVETVKKPTHVQFTTKSGERVSFRAIKTLKKSKKVHFRSKKK